MRMTAHSEDFPKRTTAVSKSKVRPIIDNYIIFEVLEESDESACVEREKEKVRVVKMGIGGDRRGRLRYVPSRGPTTDVLKPKLPHAIQILEFKTRFPFFYGRLSNIHASSTHLRLHKGSHPRTLHKLGLGLNVRTLE